MIIDGKQIAADIVAGLKTLPEPKKFLAVVLVGEDPVSVSFLKIKEGVAKKLGVDFRLYKFSETIKNDDLRKEVRKIAPRKTCGGVIVQLPLPEHLNAQYILNAIPPEKDVEVLGERALGAFYAGRSSVLPPAAAVVDEILKAKSYKLEAAAVAVVGLGQLVGKPVAVWLVRKTKELYLLRRGSDFSILKKADLVITGTGVPGLIKPEMLKEGAGVIDFGYSAPQARSQTHADLTQTDAETEVSESQSGNLVGDFDSASLPPTTYHLPPTIWYTPVPGGTGPILVAKIFENFYQLNQGR